LAAGGLLRLGTAFDKMTLQTDIAGNETRGSPAE
jgi:hypothetical protein